MPAKDNHPLFRPAFLVARSTMLEIIRRKDVYVLLILIILFLSAVLAARIVGIDSPEAALFLTGLGLSVSYWLAAVLTITASARQIPDELENRTIYVMLAKPITRAQFLAGKWIAVSASGVLVLVIFTSLVLLLIPSDPRTSILLLLQSFLVHGLALVLLSALTMFFSLWLPRAIAMVGGGMAFFASGHLVTLLRVRAGEEAPAFLDWTLGYVPNFNLLNLVQRYVDCGPALGFDQFSGLIVYAVIFASVFLAGSFWIFRGRTI